MTVAATAERLYNRTNATPGHVDAVLERLSEVKRALAVLKIRGHQKHHEDLILEMVGAATYSAVESHKDLPQLLDMLVTKLKTLASYARPDSLTEWWALEESRRAIVMYVSRCAECIPGFNHFRIITDEFDTKIYTADVPHKPRKKSIAPRPQAKISSQAARFKNYRR